MKVCVLCQFDVETSSYVLQHSRSLSLADLGHSVHLLVFPFKFGRRKSTLIANSLLDGGVRQTTIYSGFFMSGLKHKLFHTLSFLLRHFPSGLARMLESDLVVVQKPLPLAFVLVLGLHLFAYKGKAVCIYDDWEGIGGFATIRNADSVARKIMLSFIEEVFPFLVNGIQCVSKTNYERIMLSKTLRKKCIYLPNGASEIKAGSDREIGRKNSDFTVGHLGALKLREPIDFLIDVILKTCAEEECIRFMFLGDGEELPYLQKRCLECAIDDRVTILGYVPHRRVPETLQELDVCLLYLSLAFPYTLIDQSRSSTKLFEYMAHGRAIVSSDVGEPSYLLSHEKTALLVPNSADAFAAAICRLRRDSDLLRKVQAEARNEFVAKYSQEKLMNRFVDWATQLA